MIGRARVIRPEVRRSLVCSKRIRRGVAEQCIILSRPDETDMLAVGNHKQQFLKTRHAERLF
jgi:hypothetical protein